MSDTRLRAADLADEFRSISSDKRMEYVPAQAVHLLIAADMLDEVERLQAARDPYLEMVGFVKDENAKLRKLVRDIMPIVCHGCYERLCEMPKEEHPFVTCSFDDRMRELGVDA